VNNTLAFGQILVSRPRSPIRSLSFGFS